MDIAITFDELYQSQFLIDIVNITESKNKVQGSKHRQGHNINTLPISQEGL